MPRSLPDEKLSAPPALTNNRAPAKAGVQSQGRVLSQGWNWVPMLRPLPDKRLGSYVISHGLCSCADRSPAPASHLHESVELGSCLRRNTTLPWKNAA